MLKSAWLAGCAWVTLAGLLIAQQPPPQPPPQPTGPKPGAATPATQAPAVAAPAAQPGPSTAAVQPPAGGRRFGGLSLQNASLVEVINFLARQLGINYILDPRVRGGVTLNTYGETKDINPRELLDTILRINGFGMVQQGNIYRIVPLTDLAQMPLTPEQNTAANIPEDDRPMLNLVFLKYATVEELAKLLDPFVGPGGKTWAYPPANLLLVLDSRRNMKRLMELVSLFDSDTLASQRVRLFEVENGRPSDIAKELEGILKSVSLSDKNSPVRFLPLNRINTLVAVAPNPGVFEEVERWLRKIDVAVKSKAGSVDNYVYRVKYGRSELLAMGIMQLYMGMWGMGSPMGMMGMGGYGMGMMGSGMYGGGMGSGMYGAGMMGGMYGNNMYGAGMGSGMYGAGMMGGAGMYGAGMYGGGMYGAGMYGGGYQNPAMAPQQTATGAPGAQGASTGSSDQTGSYLGAGGAQGMGGGARIPRVVPNAFDNSLMIQATAEEYEGILKLLRDLDIPPRQVLIEAKVYEVSLTGSLSAGVEAYLQRKDAGTPNQETFPKSDWRQFQGSLTSGGLGLTAGTLVGKSRELLATVSAFEESKKSRVISAPSVIATDSVPATITVGSEVPTLSSSSVSPIQSGGTSLFANTVQNRQSGVSLNVVAHVNTSGIVTLMIAQEVSVPIAPDADSAIQSPSFSKRTVTTQVTLQDGDTIAIGGIIQETDTNSSQGVPFLNRIPGLGAAFGSKGSTKERTELMVFMTPRVIYDTNEVTEATEEMKSQMNRLQKLIR